MRRSLALLRLAGCPAERSLCDDVCGVLMADCGYAAFPDIGSCEQGCDYAIYEGADIRSLHSCLLDASCDTPSVLACSRAYGGAP